MKKRYFTLLFVVFLSVALKAQDTITMMQYNLLYYGNYTDWCTQSNNDMTDKADYIATIVEHVKPDIFTVNEMDGSTYAAGHLLGNALNIDGTTYYGMSYPGSDYLINMLYYDSRKLELVNHYAINTDLRKIDIYVLQSLQTADPVEFHVAVAHLKAGNGDQEAVLRAQMTEDFMNYLSGFSNQTNWIFAGDLNVYDANEAAYQNLVNPNVGDVVFNDPVNQAGSWHINYSFRDYHTQSTHTDYDDCPSGGGLDDRFDFILVSDDVLSGVNDFIYVEDSYEALGQDGNHYNTSLIDGYNSAAPSEVIDALYNNSDHLPVIAKFAIGEASYVADITATENLKITGLLANPGGFEFTLEQQIPADGRVEVFDLTGQLLQSKRFAGAKQQQITMQCDYSGMLILRVSTGRGDQKAVRLVR
ncbi:MAG: endonuclease/exonuclease/phosphatase family protein [Bacteroidales bacterium]